MTQDSNFYLAHLLTQNLSNKISIQIKKEFEKINTPLHGELELNDYEKSKEVISEKIKLLESEMPNKLVELMYHSDIAEEKVINALQENENHHEILAEQLIFRSAQKVYYQIKYATKKTENGNF